MHSAVHTHVQLRPSANRPHPTVCRVSSAHQTSKYLELLLSVNPPAHLDTIAVHTQHQILVCTRTIQFLHGQESLCKIPPYRIYFIVHLAVKTLYQILICYSYHSTNLIGIVDFPFYQKSVATIIFHHHCTKSWDNHSLELQPLQLARKVGWLHCRSKLESMSRIWTLQQTCCIICTNFNLTESEHSWRAGLSCSTCKLQRCNQTLPTS